MKRAKADYRIQTVRNAIRVLEAFRDADELGVTEISRRLGLHKNNVFRLLATLEAEGWVEQFRGNDRYRLGVSCVELAQSFARRGNLMRRGRVALEELARATRECAHLGILRSFAVVHLDGEPAGDQLVSTSLRLGSILDAHCTALGKTLLAFSPALVRERFDRERIGGGTLPAHTSATITDRDKFFEHLRMVASQGWALDLEETAPGLCCASAPIHDASGRLVAALSVSGPAFRLGQESLLANAVPAVTEAAERLSRQLGYTGA